STAVATLLTFCPPGPDARMKRSTISSSGIRAAAIAPSWPPILAGPAFPIRMAGQVPRREAEKPQRPAEFRVRRRGDGHPPAVPRMRELKPPPMQQHAVDPERAEVAVVAAVAVAGVADEVVRGVLEVAPDLAEAPGFRRGPEQRVAGGGEACRRHVQLRRGQAR